MIFNAFFAAVGQISDPRFRRVLLLGVGLALALLVGTTALFVTWIDWATGDSFLLPIIGEVKWIGDVLSWGGLFVMFFLSVFLMIPVASAITSMFLEDVAQAVEDVHYPHLPAATRVPFWDAVRDTVNFLGLLIGANVLALILYALLFWVPFLPLVIFWGLNGFLLGREYFTLAAMRRVGRARAKELRKLHRGKIWMAGVLMAMPLSLPLINLVIPILGAATFTHLYHKLTGNVLNRD